MSSVVYINDFDEPTYQWEFLPTRRIERLLTGFEPAYSQFLFLYTGKGPIHGFFERFGSMLPGTTPPPNAPAVDIVIEEMKARLCIGPMLGTLVNPFTGAAVTVDASAASAAQDQSQGFFLVPGFKISAIDVSVTFDTPIATTADKWSVALILKSGDQTEQLSDHFIGVTCQFKAGGVYVAVLRLFRTSPQSRLTLARPSPTMTMVALSSRFTTPSSQTRKAPLLQPEAFRSAPRRPFLQLRRSASTWRIWTSSPRSARPLQPRHPSLR
jgi:hypothetical protein